MINFLSADQHEIAGRFATSGVDRFAEPTRWSRLADRRTRPRRRPELPARAGRTPLRRRRPPHRSSPASPPTPSVVSTSRCSTTTAATRPPTARPTLSRGRHATRALAPASRSSPRLLGRLRRRRQGRRRQARAGRRAADLGPRRRRRSSSAIRPPRWRSSCPVSSTRSPKFVQFANLSGGPQTTEAFRAHALDLGSVAEIPPIHATWTGLHVKIVASKFRQDPMNHPIYELGHRSRRLRSRRWPTCAGKKIAYSPGQAQGALVLKVLKKAGLTKEDVKLVELPSTGDVYSNALAGKQVDVAPIGGVQIKRYLTKYGKDGATTIPHGMRDDAGHLYGPVESLEDPGKAAAIRAYVAAWGVAQDWIDKHPKEWIAGVLREGPGPDRGRRPVARRQRRAPGHQRRLERRDRAAAGNHRAARQGDRQQGRSRPRTCTTCGSRPSPRTRSREAPK